MNSMVYDDLAQHLKSLERESNYRVDAVLKESPAEVTQRVYFAGANGAEQGPYIRKFIQREFGFGSEYEHIFAAQQSGRRFKYVPDVLECYSRNGELVVVMECVKGETLQEVVYRQDPSLDLARKVFPQLCDAVTELHCSFDTPIIHRDLKPSNIILSDGGLAIIDFGIAREQRDNAESDTTHFGTRGFAPPEQFGFGQTTVRSDVYSLGMVLYFCLTETIPDSDTRSRKFADPRIPEPIRSVIAQAAAFDPDDRFASAQALKAAFELACDPSTPVGNPHIATNPSHAGTQSAPAGSAAGRRSAYANPAINANAHTPPGAAGVGFAQPPSEGFGNPGVGYTQPSPAGFGNSGIGYAQPSSAGFGNPGAGYSQPASPNFIGGSNGSPATSGSTPYSVPPHYPSGGNATPQPGMRAPQPIPGQPAMNAHGISHKALRVLGEAWNLFLAIIGVTIFFQCADWAVHQPGAAAANPLWFNFFVMYGYILPSSWLLLFTLADKRRLKNKFPRLAQMRWWKWVVALLVVVLVGATVTAILAVVLGYSYNFSTSVS